MWDQLTLLVQSKRVWMLQLHKCTGGPMILKLVHSGWRERKKREEDRRKKERKNEILWSRKGRSG